MRLDVGKLDMRSATDAKRKAAREAACQVVAENVLSDCTPYVPIRFGHLRESGQATAHGDSATVAWGTDADTAKYARVQYYGTLRHTTEFNPSNARATSHWFDKVKPEREDAWRGMFGKAYEGALR